MLLAAAWLALVLVQGETQAPPSEPPPAALAPTDDELRARWKKLAPEVKRAVAGKLLEELAWVDSYQAKLSRAILRTQDRDPSTWPEASPHWFDPAEHAPRGTVKRTVLPADSPKAAEVRKRLLRKVPDPKLVPAWVYDYGTRGLVRVGDATDPERVFANALAGFAPDADLVVALVERALDDGAQQKALEAFGHAYTDRDGNVYPGLTLYDAWASSAQMEMPDVDCLGIVHDVLGDHTTWTAPVPGSQHDKLYARIGELFAPARSHRALRHALARCYAGGSVVLRDNYQPLADRLHALWDAHDSDPAKLLPDLPSAERIPEFLDEWGRTTDREPERLAAGVDRRATLDQGGREVRAALIRALDAPPELPKEAPKDGSKPRKAKGSAGGSER